MTATPSTTRTPSDDGLTHAALMYRRPEQLQIALAEFVRDGSRAGEAMLVVLPAAHLDGLGDALDGAGDALTVQDMAEIGRNPARLLPFLVDWLADQTAPARIVSEMFWPQRSYAESVECLRHEALLNHVLAAAAVSILCPFDAEHLESDVLAGAELTHPQLIDEGGTRPSPSYGDPLDLARGENWPQAEPVQPVSDLDFEGDLWRLRHTLADDPVLEGLDAARRDDLVFAINEAASNAVRHGDGHARARVWRDGDGVVGEVSTSSPIDDPLAGRRTPAAADTGGRGLWLINQVCDLVEIRSSHDGATVRMHVAA